MAASIVLTGLPGYGSYHGVVWLKQAPGERLWRHRHWRHRVRLRGLIFLRRERDDEAARTKARRLIEEWLEFLFDSAGVFLTLRPDEAPFDYRDPAAIAAYLARLTKRDRARLGRFDEDSAVREAGRPFVRVPLSSASQLPELEEERAGRINFAATIIALGLQSCDSAFAKGVPEGREDAYPPPLDPKLVELVAAGLRKGLKGDPTKAAGRGNVKAQRILAHVSLVYGALGARRIATPSDAQITEQKRAFDSARRRAAASKK